MHSTDEKQALANAFATFNAHSVALHQSYAALQEQVARMATELRESRDARLKEQAEKIALAERLTHILEALPAAIVVMDDDGLVTDANAVAMELFGTPLLGVAWDRVAARCRLDATRADMFRIGSRWFTVTTSRPGAGGAIQVWTDVTEGHMAREQELRQSRLAMLGEMAARVAHQIRTPLATALLYATGSSVTADNRQRIVSRLRELEGMVEDMLAFARGTPPADSALNSRELLQQVAADATELVPDHVVVDLAPGLGGYALRGNQRALVGALHNLVANAAQHCGNPGRIRLSDTLDAHGWVRLIVQDNGPGIDDTVRERIFEPFFTTRPDGTGLGLAVVRSVAIAHAGDIECASDPDGSVFSLRLPLAPEGECADRDRLRSPVPSHQEELLYA